MSAAAPSPLPTASWNAPIGGIDCAFSLTAYADRLLVIASQTGTLGAVLHAERETVLGGGSTYRIDTLLGRRDEPLPELAARQLAERLAAAGCDRPLLLCLALQRAALTPAAIRELLAQVLEHPVWGPAPAAGPAAAAAPPPV